MGEFICSNPKCGKHFKSKHSTAMFCSRNCAGSRAKVHLRGVHKPRKVSDEDAIKVLEELGRKLGKTPSQVDFKEHVKEFSPSIYKDRFGSWNQAIVLANMEPNISGPYVSRNSNRDIIRNSLRYRILKRDGFRCQYCGGTPQLGYVLNVDHRIPASKGGKAVEENLITACWFCNSGKSDID